MTLQIIPRESEEQWLRERRSRITATDIGRLANGGPSVFAAVKAEKSGSGGFRGNRYTEWGHEREPVMLQHLSFLYGIEPNDALYVNGGRAATPDGAGNGWLAEAKTTVRAWDDLDDLRQAKPQYVDQVLWAQLVAETDRTVFVFEPHRDFVPDTIRHFEIYRDERRIKQLIEVEERFIEYWHAEAEAGEWDDLMARYADADAALREAQATVDALKEEFRSRAGDREVEARTPFGSISYSTPKPRRVFNQAAFKAEHADLAKKYMEEVPAKAPTLRITVK